LGWRKTQLQKGVYMDGHECPDVVKYCEDIFLPHIVTTLTSLTQVAMKGKDLRARRE
jgi:hypothetical protein